MVEVMQAGLPLGQAKKALILLHGRGGTSESILSLSSYLELPDFALFAPQAAQRSWYPFGFMASDQGNLLSLESSIKKVSRLFEQLQDQGMPTERIFLLGFSQGACLSLEFAARHGQKLGGVVAFTGGLIGEKLVKENYSGNFQETPVYISSSVRDMHVPAKRIQDSAQLLRDMGAAVYLKWFEDEQHTVRPEEIAWVNQQLFL